MILGYIRESVKLTSPLLMFVVDTSCHCDTAIANEIWSVWWDQILKALAASPSRIAESKLAGNVTGRITDSRVGTAALGISGTDL